MSTLPGPVLGPRPWTLHLTQVQWGPFADCPALATGAPVWVLGLPSQTCSPAARGRGGRSELPALTARDWSDTSRQPTVSFFSWARVPVTLTCAHGSSAKCGLPGSETSRPVPTKGDWEAPGLSMAPRDPAGSSQGGDSGRRLCPSVGPPGVLSAEGDQLIRCTRDSFTLALTVLRPGSLSVLANHASQRPCHCPLHRLPACSLSVLIGFSPCRWHEGAAPARPPEPPSSSASNL